MLQFRAEENKRGGAPLQNVILVFANASDPSFGTPRQDDQTFVKIRPRPTDHTKQFPARFQPLKKCEREKIWRSVRRLSQRKLNPARTAELSILRKRNGSDRP
jgi:hypothetical protein